MSRLSLSLGRRVVRAVVVFSMVALGIAAPRQSVAAQSPSTDKSVVDTVHGPAFALPLREAVTLRVPGNSRFAGEVSGRDTVLRHLAAMGIAWERLGATRPAFALAPDEAAWMVRLRSASGLPGALTLVAATRDIDGEVTLLELFVHDEALLARVAPRDDGVQRTSLAAQRNMRQVQAIHGSGGHTRFLAASRARVLAILDETVPAGRWPQLVQYRFDASGRVSSLHAVLPLGLSCCNSSGSNETFAFMITPP